MASDDRATTPTPEYSRVWETVGVASDATTGTSFTFKIMSYNVLAQGLLERHQYLYKRCARKYLLWEIRAIQLYNEIVKESPDILCLQEIEASHLNFYAKFEEIGYLGVFKKKSGDSLIDGCAIFFKRNIFKLEEVNKVEFYQPKVSLLNRHHIGVIVKLTPWSMPDSPIIVATTHLLYNPKKAIVRLAQLRLFLAEIDRVSYVYDGRNSGHLPIILAGDMNSYPDSLIVQLLDEGQINVHLDWDNNEWRRIGITDNCQHLSVYLNRQAGWPTYFNELEIYNSEYSPPSSLREGIESSPAKQLHHAMFSEMFNSGILSHSLHFRSVYDKKTKQKNRHSETTASEDYWVLVDYIHYNACTGLRPLERLRLFTTEEHNKLGQFPNAHYGSDHLSLAVSFELRSNKPF